MKFDFKPALMGAGCEVRVTQTGAEMSRGSRSQRVRFADVTGVRLVEVSARTSSTSLVLLHAEGKFALQYAGRVSAAASDDDAAEYVRACAAILDALAAVKPEVEVSFGGTVGLRATMAGLGVAMAVLGALVALIPLGEGPVDGEAVTTALMALLIVFGGLALAVTYNPFKAPPRLKVGLAANVLRAHLPETVG